MSSEQKQSTVYMRITNEIAEAIKTGIYSVGSKLPPVRELSEHFSVSIPTIQRVIQELVRMELIACGTGRQGTVVIRSEIKQPAKPTTLACLLRPYKHRARNMVDNFGLDMIQGLQDGISENGYRFIHHCYDEHDYEARMLELAGEPWLAGIVVDQRTPEELIEKLIEKGKPVVSLNRLINIPKLSAVAPDYKRIGKETLKIMQTKGYQRFGIYPWFGNEAFAANKHSVYDRHHGFVQEAIKQGIPFESICRIPEVFPKDPINDTMKDFGFPQEKPADWQRLGVSCASDTTARHLIEVIRKSNYILGQDIGVIGSMNMECNLNYEHPFSTWNADRHAIGFEAATEVINRIESPDSPRSFIKIPTTFIDRGSA